MSETEHQDDTEGTTPTASELVDQVLDLLVYAPIGLALEAREIVPKLAQRGRGQVAMARLMSRFAAQKGQTEASKIVTAAVEGFRTGLESSNPGGDSVSDTPGSADDAEPTDPDDLPIAGYDQLAAAQVVKRLPALSASELAVLAEHETNTRGRVTILNRIASLLDA